MSTAEATRITGGCQCGAVRYALHVQIEKPSICFCRMCQKAFGSYFAPTGGVPVAAYEVTRGTISYFRSSDPVDRGFCNQCGTPLNIRDVSGTRIDISLGSLDRPAAIQPGHAVGIEGRMPWFDKLMSLPGMVTEDDGPREFYDEISASNHQHPDHDTVVWPPHRGGRT
jgi:hypothetical protein